LKIRKQLRGANSTMMEIDYSTYTLSQLFKARYWIDTRGRSLEEEIQKRCTHIRERTHGKPSAAAGTSGRFKPSGLIFGVICLLFSVGPFFAVMLFDTINLVNDVNGDKGGLSGVWAFLTLPVMVIVFLIGSMMDAERIVKWFDLDGGS
jgi:hypothetical protein